MKFLNSLLESLKLSPEDKKLLKKVFFISLTVCVIIVAAAWIIQRASIKKIHLDDSQKSSESDVTMLYSKKSNDLLPIDIEAHKYIALQHKEDMDFNRTIKHLLRILSVERNNRKVKLDLATTYLKACIYDKAEETFRELIEEGVSDSLSDPIMSRYGLTLFFSGKIDESIAQLEKTLKQFQDSSKEAFCYLGQVKAAQNLASEKAEAYLKKSLELDSHYAEAWYQLARYYMGKPQPNAADYNNARKCLIKQMEIEPLNPKAHSRLGMVYYYLQEPHLAEKSYKMALTLNDKDYNTHYNLGELYYSLFSDPKKALEEFKKTVSIKNNHAEANFKIGLIALENDQYKESIRFFKEANKYSPHNIRILLQMGVAYEKIGMENEAVTVYQSILDLDKLNDVALQKLKLLSSRQ